MKVGIGIIEDFQKITRIPASDPTGERVSSLTSLKVENGYNIVIQKYS
jgi:hypothetical protein